MKVSKGWRGIQGCFLYIPLNYSYLEVSPDGISVRGSVSLYHDPLEIQVNEELVLLGCSII